MSEIEAEIRRQMLEERDRALQSQVSSPSGSVPVVPPLPTGPSYPALPPPSFVQAPAAYPPNYPSDSYSPPPLAPLVSAPALPSGPAAVPPSGKRKGLLGGLSAVGIALAKFGSAFKGLLIGLKFLSMGKFLLTAGSILVSIVAYSGFLGWRLAAGIVFMIFLHEAGHALAVIRLGYKVTAMVFVPLMGAFVRHEAGASAAQTAQIAIMGPVAGTLAGLGFGAAYGATGSPLWLVLAFYSFMINLFNLSAIPFLDGGRITVLIPPKALLGGLLAAAVISWRFPLCWLLLLFALPQIISQWKSGSIDPALHVGKQDQRTYTLAYLSLVLFLGLASMTTQTWMNVLRQHGHSHRVRSV